MRLSAPICRLKRRVKLLSRREGIPLSQALDRLAVEEDFSSWSPLAAKAFMTVPLRALFERSSPATWSCSAPAPVTAKKPP